MRGLDGQVALVTGAAQGLGEAIARRLHEEGCRVACADRDLAGVRALADDLGERAVAVEVDVAQRASVEACAAEAAESLGPVRLLVNNAGIQRIGPSETLDRELWQQVVDVNLTGLFDMCQVVCGPMLLADGGAVVNIASSNSERGMPGRTPYCATKTGVVGLTRALAVEWAQRGVRVNAVEPGYIGTPMVRNAIAGGLIDEGVLLDRIPARRVGDPAEVAAACAFLLSEDAAYVTGTTLAVDGGFLAYGAPAPTSQDQTGRLDP